MTNFSDKAKEAEMDVEKDKPVQSTPLLCSTRLGLSIVGFFMFFHLYAQRVGMSVAIVSMVNQTAVSMMTADSGEQSDAVNSTYVPSADQCSREVRLNGSVHEDGPFVWEKSIQGHILGSFFYGYLISQIPGGLLAERFGAKWVIAGFLGLSTVATLLTPVASRISFGLLIVLRVLCGIGSGVLFPAMHAMLGQWAPPMERSFLGSMVVAGTMMGNVVSMPVAGLLCQYGFSEGWDSVFYVIGITSTITIILWILLTSNTPTEHQRISKQEREYIVNSLKGEVTEHQPTLCEMPWRQIFSSGPVWGIIVANFCVDWGLYTYLTNIPTFFYEVLFFDIQSNGFYSALPFLGLWAATVVFPLIADKLRSAGIMKTVTVRRVFNTTGMFGAGLFLIGLSYLDCTQTKLAVLLLVLAVSMSGFVYSGYFVNHMDIAPQYAGTLMGIGNGIAAISGFVAPYVASRVTESRTRESWQIVFFIAAGVYAVGGIIFCVLTSGTIQPWAIDKARITAELEVMDGKNGSDGHGPIYRPKSQSNGELPTDPMLTEKA